MGENSIDAVVDLIEKLRSVKWEVIDDDDWDSRCVFVDMRPDDFEALLNEAAALEAAREDACVALVADIRFACGDNGKRSQPELVEYIRGLARDAERYRWLKKSALCNVWARGDGIALVVPRTPTASIDSRIDAEMAKENKS